MRYEVGVDKMMWGNDYPHHEATYPYTRECLRHSFSDVHPVEVAAMLGANAAKVYDFDMDLMRKVAVEIEAPTVAEVQVPLDEIPDDATSMAFEVGPTRDLVVANESLSRRSAGGRGTRGALRKPSTPRSHARAGRTRRG